MNDLMLDAAGRVVWCTWRHRRHDLRLMRTEYVGPRRIDWYECSRCDLFDFEIAPWDEPR